ncbi:ATP-binding protein [Streptomyces sp. NBC_00078]|uniref:ATP-binding protein n=1 Tax=Streptomyces sp. NBC_00078 TaxID=2975643 RepID=UPI0022569C00|nr:ATP-binding protein [Streptomyces sp. NBC_00078]MCX5426082.1 ATP-binding protein [Streptomyces sp. NBC_00078]
MKVLQKVGTFLGVGGDRSAAAPQYVGLADGLIITDTHTEAWYVLASSNTDLMSETARDGELDAANSALARTLAGHDCHLRVLWSPLHAEDYAAEAAGGMFTSGAWDEWAELRVRRLEQIGLPSRHLLLGVRLTERTGQAQKISRRGVQEGLGLSSSSISTRELAKLDAQMRRLGRRLESSPWKAQPAAVEMLAWMISREQHRTAPLPAPSAAGVISGAKLAALTRGRILPHPDHLRVVDAHGKVSAWVSVLSMTGFPEQMESPGNGEWLRVLSEINYVPDVDEEQLDEDVDPAALILPVSPEASVRFRVMPKRDALKKVDQARRLAKEQRRSAARQSAEDPGRDIEETEEVMAELTRDMRREDVTLVEDHPRLVITSTISLDDLRSQVDAVITHYGGLGIEVSVGEEEQRELWIESQPGDQIRVPDLGHVRDVTALSGSWWWGGAKVGDDNGPIVGYLTGSTPGVFRNDVTAGSDRGDATTTAYVGRSGRGKTTAMMLSMLDAGFRGAYCLALDFKGDLGGVVTAARRYGLDAHLVETGPAFAGVCDLFTLLTAEGTDAARGEVPAQLSIAAPEHLRERGAETPITRATNEVIKAGNPATWKVIEYLRQMDDPLARETGEALWELSQNALGAPFMGRPTGDAPPLAPKAGIWVVQMPGLSLPGAESTRKEWNPMQRLSVALMHSMLAYGVTTAGRRDLRGLRKAVCVPEVHVLTATREGSNFLQYIARVGRALATSLLLDTQDPESLVKLVGVIEQLTTVAGFQLTTRDQQDALAELLGLPKDQHTRALIQSVGLLPDGEIRHGHSIIRDRRFSCATVQWDVPSLELLDLLDTSPKAAQNQADGTVTMEKAGV